MTRDSSSLAVYRFDLGVLVKIDCIFEHWHEGEKGISIVFCFNWSFVFVNTFLKIALSFADVMFVAIFA